MTDRRRFLQSLAAGLPLAGATTAAAQQRSSANLPNILYILADDLGIGDPSCYNTASKTPTPALDRFARQGIRFTDAHSPSAVCTPTRYGIMTGRYCWRTVLKSGVLWGYSPSLIEPGRLTVASLLKSKGYVTAGIGKWHLGLGSQEKADYSKPFKPSPIDYGFDSYFGIPASLDMDPYVYIENDRAIEQPTATVQELKEQRGIFYRGGPVAPGFKHIEVLPTLTNRAVSWIAERPAKSGAKPWFLYLPVTAPHTPWLPTDRFKGKSGAGPYGDFVTMFDDTVAQVLHALDKSGQAEDTLVVITSDNGAHWLPGEIEKWNHRANDNWRGQKADIWDAGHRVPMLARWPGRIRAGSVTRDLVCHTDFMATIAEITGTKLSPNAGEDSISFLPSLLNRAGGKPARDTIVHHSVEGHFAVRRGHWKLHLGRGSGGFSLPVEYKPKQGEPVGELFDLAADPAEKNNLYGKRPEIVKELTALLEKYQKQGFSRPVA